MNKTKIFFNITAGKLMKKLSITYRIFIARYVQSRGAYNIDFN